ncbi:hypothetical protein [Enterococcus hirae]|nr:hypothetical protein [Enterococcus hirae]
MPALFLATFISPTFIAANCWSAYGVKLEDTEISFPLISWLTEL